MVKEADPNNTGRVTYEDFIQKILTKFEWHPKSISC